MLSFDGGPLVRYLSFSWLFDVGCNSLFFRICALNGVIMRNYSQLLCHKLNDFNWSNK